MDLIDLEQIRQSRQAVPLARAANAILATASSLSQTGIDNDLLLRAMTIAMAKLVVEGSAPGAAEANGRSVARSLPALIEHLEKKAH